MLDRLAGQARWAGNAIWKFNLLRSGKRCFLCHGTFGHFVPFRGGSKELSPFLTVLETVGSDIDSFYCPRCGCFDRERHLAMYFDALDLWSRIPAATILHIAPEPKIAERISRCGPKLYIKGDLNSAADTVRVDVTRLPYADGTIDFVICNHVLEHVPDDERALAEIFRVLRAGGGAVLQTPFSRRLSQSFCEPGVNSDELRNLFYGQEDHVRLYGTDLFEKIKQAGFLVQIRQHTELLSHIDADVYGVNDKEPLIFSVKPHGS